MPRGRRFGEISSGLLREFARGPATVQQAARALQLSPPAAWPAARYLESRGLVQRVGSVPAPSRGRPSPVYAAPAAAPAAAGRELEQVIQIWRL